MRSGRRRHARRSLADEFRGFGNDFLHVGVWQIGARIRQSGDSGTFRRLPDARPRRESCCPRRRMFNLLPATCPGRRVIASIKMTVKHFVASAFALLLLLSTAGTAVAGHAALLCPASHAKLDAALHDRFHAAPGGSRVQAIVRVSAPALDTVAGLVALLGGQLHALHQGLSALTLEIEAGALGILAATPSILSISTARALLEAHPLHPAVARETATARWTGFRGTRHFARDARVHGRWTGAALAWRSSTRARAGRKRHSPAGSAPFETSPARPAPHRTTTATARTSPA